MIATGRFPMIERVMKEARHLSSDEAFEGGHECVLDGIGGRLLR
jgi:hypothetical protein